MVNKRSTVLTTLMRAGLRQQRAAVRLLGALAPATPPRPLRPSRKTSTGRAPAAGSWHALSFTMVGAHMRYWLFLPASASASASASAPMPLAVMLHGCDQTAVNFADGSGINRLAEKAGFAVLYPQQSVAGHPHRCWKWYERATQQGGGDAALIVAVVKAVLAAYRLDRSRVYIGGISAGAAMAHIVALNWPDVFAAVGLHSGPVFGAGHSGVGALGVMQHGAPARADAAIDEVLQRQGAGLPLPTIVIHGEDDAVVRPVNQLQLAGQALRFNGIAGGSEKLADRVATRRTLAYRTRDVYQGRSLMLRLVRIAGLGHAWSGGDARLKFNSGQGPNAGKLMLDFFARHRR
ncbi:extracellular catalytic domain type 1 short-chain-length polyhydroxyalkanoate depolymerase [Massilia sp. PWRC2]|uniref:extracellular catalytic domain type 1 short-chain-length polyhydroxyalkanoate depolymerase n=1 Tax=Massilia sp. PWRC2 TaxID=2804626 RepID=UPI003CFA1393